MDVISTSISTLGSKQRSVQLSMFLLASYDASHLISKKYPEKHLERSCVKESFSTCIYHLPFNKYKDQSKTSLSRHNLLQLIIKWNPSVREQIESWCHCMSVEDSQNNIDINKTNELQKFFILIQIILLLFYLSVCLSVAQCVCNCWLGLLVG